MRRAILLVGGGIVGCSSSTGLAPHADQPSSFITLSELHPQDDMAGLAVASARTVRTSGTPMRERSRAESAEAASRELKEPESSGSNTPAPFRALSRAQLRSASRN
jgi:hypothetical protein